MPPAARVGDMHVCPLVNLLVPELVVPDTDAPARAKGGGAK